MHFCVDACECSKPGFSPKFSWELKNEKNCFTTSVHRRCFNSLHFSSFPKLSGCFPNFCLAIMEIYSRYFRHAITVPPRWQSYINRLALCLQSDLNGPLSAHVDINSKYQRSPNSSSPRGVANTSAIAGRRSDVLPLWNLAN